MENHRINSTLLMYIAKLITKPIRSVLIDIGLFILRTN